MANEKKSSRSFDLDKGGNRSFDLEKKTTRAFDLSKEPQESATTSQNKNVQQKPASRQSNCISAQATTPSSSQSTGVPPVQGHASQNYKNGGGHGSSNAKWLWIVFAVIVLAALAYWLMSGVGHSDTPQTSEPDSIVAAPADSMVNRESSDSVAADTTAIVESSDAEGQVDDVQQGTPVGAPQALKDTQTESADVSQSNHSSSTVNESASSAESAVPAGSIDEHARQVIKGAYGNNPVRRHRLGADYHAIQKRVNELMCN